jgi:hypothetical protein
MDDYITTSFRKLSFGKIVVFIQNSGYSITLNHSLERKRIKKVRITEYHNCTQIYSPCVLIKSYWFNYYYQVCHLKKEGYKLRYFKILIPIIILILAIIVEGGCFQKPIFAPYKTTIKGQIIRQVVNKQDKTISEQKVAGAIVHIIDPTSGLTITQSNSDQEGLYSLQVPPGGPYVVQAEKENLRISKVTPVMRLGESKSIRLIDAESTAIALLYQELNKREQTPEDVDLELYSKNQFFSDLVHSINVALLSNKNPAKSPAVQNYMLLVLAQTGIDGQSLREKTVKAQYALVADKKSGFSSLKLRFNNRSTAYALDFSEDSVTADTNITLTVPYGTDVSNLVATFTTSEGAAVTVGNVVQESGVTPNDFSRPVEYVITAQDGVTKKTYTISVVIAPNTECEITEMKFSSFDSEMIGMIADNNITLTVPYGTDISNLVTSFATSEEATVTVGNVVQVSGITPNDFTNPVEYLVTAQDGVTKKTFTVTVEIAPNTECELIHFGFIDPPVSVSVPETNE